MKNDTVVKLDNLMREGREMRKRHIRQQNMEDMVMKGLFVAVCPLLFPILFIKD